MKLMIVDDDSYIADVIAAFLKSKACEVVIYSAMSDGLRHLVKEKFDGIILDLHMPGMNAIEAIPIVKEISPNAVLGIISSDTSAGVKNAVLKAGADFFLQKCNEIPNIMEMVKKVQESRGSAVKV
jgi:DNA-binding response OmpR family regulator